MASIRFAASIGNAPAPSVPTWYSSASANEWTALPNSTLSTSGVGWSGTSPGGSGTYTAVVTAWSGGILNTVGCFYGGAFHIGTFLVIFGGGHSDYGGNEVYAYGPLEDDSPAWHRLTDPTIPAPENETRDASGYPVARHTYDTLQFLPTLNKMICVASPGYYSLGSSFAVVDVFDFATDPSSANPWSTADTGFPFATGTYELTNMLSAYNATTGKVWALGKGNSQKLAVYDVAGGTWTGYNKDNPNGPHNVKAAVDPGNNLFVFVNAGTVYVQDLGNPTSALYTPTVTGTAPDGGCVVEYDDTGNRFVVWDNDGKAFYALTPGADPSSGGDAWAWSSLTPATGDTPAVQTTNGTYGRFRMNNGDLRGAVLMPTYDAPICFFKM